MSFEKAKHGNKKKLYKNFFKHAIKGKLLLIFFFTS